MKSYIILLMTLLTSCNKHNKTGSPKNIFKPSFKQELKNKNISKNVEILDTLNNIYSNYKYMVAFDAPDNWTVDKGVNDYTIYRTYERDSSITFSINVIELKNDSDFNGNIWEHYQKNKSHYELKEIIEKQLNTKVKNYIIKKSYLRNQVSLKHSFSYLVNDLDFEYNDTSIVYQTILNGYTYTFYLHVPTVFYNKHPTYYDNLFLNISFLVNKYKFN